MNWIIFILILFLLALSVALIVLISKNKRPRRLRGEKGDTGQKGANGLTGSTGSTGPSSIGSASTGAWGQCFGDGIGQTVANNASVIFDSANPESYNTAPAIHSTQFGIVVPGVYLYTYFALVQPQTSPHGSGPGIRSFTLTKNGADITGSKAVAYDPNNNNALLNTLEITGTGIFNAAYGDFIQLKNTSGMDMNVLFSFTTPGISNISLTLTRLGAIPI